MSKAAWISIVEAAGLLGVAPVTVSAMIERGEMTTSSLPGGEGKSYRRLLRADFWDFVRRNKVRLPPGVDPPQSRWLVVSNDQRLSGDLMALGFQSEIGQPVVIDDIFRAGLALAGPAWYSFILLDAMVDVWSTLTILRHVKTHWSYQPVGVILPEDVQSLSWANNFEKEKADFVWRKPVDAFTVLREIKQRIQNA